MPARNPRKAAGSPQERLEALIDEALGVARKARKHKQNLSGDNYYANRLAELRADAVNTFRDLSSSTTGDTSALAELIDTVFSPAPLVNQRVGSARELVFALRTTWRSKGGVVAHESAALFPLTILDQTRRGYLSAVGRQMNGCFSAGWYDACAVMMRRLLEISIIEAFEANSIAQKIRGVDGNYLHLSDLVKQALVESKWTLSRNTRRFLPQLRDLGDMSAHGRYYLAGPDDIERIRHGCRVVVEEFLHHARLL